jgi:hypothetical protein
MAAVFGTLGLIVAAVVKIGIPILWKREYAVCMLLIFTLLLSKLHLIIMSQLFQRAVAATKSMLYSLQPS